MHTALLLAKQIFKNDYAKKEYMRISKLFSTAKIRAVILKGPFLNEICHIQKESHDLDILVSENDLQSAWELLIQYYEPYMDSQIYIDYCHNNDCRSLGVNHLAVLFPKSDSSALAHPVELHFSIAPCYYADFGVEASKYNLKDFDVFSETSEIEFENEHALVLNPTLQFWTLLLHYSSHYITGLRDHVLKGTRIHAYKNLLFQIARYWAEKHDDIDVSKVFNWSLRWNRCLQTYLPIKLLNDLYDAQIPITDDFGIQTDACANTEGMDVVRKALPLLKTLPSECWERDIGFPEFSTIFKSIMKAEEINDLFGVRELVGLRYNQRQTDHWGWGRILAINANLDEIQFEFAGIRTQQCIEDFQNQQQFEQERGTPGLYITFFEFSTKCIQRTFLCPFDQSKCKGTYLLFANESDQYVEKVSCRYKISHCVNDEIKISLAIPARKLGLVHKNEVYFNASVGAYEPYFHMIDTYYIYRA